jgi:nicotinamidase-related amidase
MEKQTNNQETALLVMDVQEAAVNMLKDSAPLIHSITKAIQTARNHKVPVIYAVIGFRKGFPEVSPNNKSLSRLKNGTLSIGMEEAAKVHSSIEPQPDDIIVTKKRVSAFTGSDLEVVLRSLGIKHIVLAGISTSGVVLSTLREAADKDYSITVLSDCCADPDDEVHRILTTKIFPRHAQVVSSDEWYNDERSLNH